MPADQARKVFADAVALTATTMPVTSVDIDGADAEKLMHAWNDKPPVSQDQAREILIAASPASRTATFLFVNQGQACGGIRELPITGLREWLRDAFLPTKSSHDEGGHVTPWDDGV
jgi:hypothetical protein